MFLATARELGGGAGVFIFVSKIAVFNLPETTESCTAN